MKNFKQRILEGQFYRAAEVRGKVDEKTRTVQVSFSSEEPYRRWFGVEVLGHRDGEVDLSFMSSGRAPVLLDHDHKQQVGVVVRAWVENSRGYAIVKLSKSPKGREVEQDINDGIKSNLSVGYEITEMELVGDDSNGVEVFRMRWRPFEASLVSVPADVTVGVGRSNSNNSMEQIMKDENTTTQTTTIQQPTELEAERARVRSILALGEQHGFENDAAGAVRNNMSLDQFREYILKQLSGSSRIVENFAPEMGSFYSAKGQGYSVARAIRAGIDQNWRGSEREYEQHLELQRQAGGSRGGKDSIFIPFEAIAPKATRALSVGNATYGGGNLVEESLLSSRLIENLANESVIFALNVPMLTGLIGDITIPKHTGTTAGAWLAAEGDNATETTPSFDPVSAQPHDVCAYVDLTRRMMQQSSIDIESFIKGDLRSQFALGIDLAALSGTGANGQPLGLSGTTGVGVVDFTTEGQPTFAEIVAMEAKLADANALRGNMAYVCSGNTYSYLKSTPKIAGYPSYLIEEGKLNGYRCMVSNQIADGSIYFGNWNDLLLCSWGGGFEVIVDRATLSRSGGTRLVGFWTADIVVRHPASFVIGS